MRQIIFILFMSLLLTTSCVVSKKTVGNYEEMEGKEATMKKGKDFNLFWNQVPVRNVEKHLKVSDYEIVRRRSFIDVLVFYGSVGIFSFYDVKITTKKPEQELK